MSEQLVQLFADSDYELNEEEDNQYEFKNDSKMVNVLQQLQNQLKRNEKNNKKLYQKIEQCDIMGYALLKQEHTLKQLLSIGPKVSFTFPIYSFAVFVFMFIVYIYIGYITKNR